MALFIVLFSGCNNNESDNNVLIQVSNEEGNKKTAKATEYAVEAPPFSDGTFPCTDCHANFKPNP